MMDNDKLPVPIKKSTEYIDHFECCCKNCKPKPTYDHLHCWVWHYCYICDNKIWFNVHNCTLYSRRLPKIICFNCRHPYYKKNMSSGEIHRLLIKDN
jgi:hypothetical protein